MVILFPPGNLAHEPSRLAAWQAWPASRHSNTAYQPLFFCKDFQNIPLEKQLKTVQGLCRCILPGEQKVLIVIAGKQVLQSIPASVMTLIPKQSEDVAAPTWDLHTPGGMAHNYTWRWNGLWHCTGISFILPLSLLHPPPSVKTKRILSMCSLLSHTFVMQ